MKIRRFVLMCALGALSASCGGGADGPTETPPNATKLAVVSAPSAVGDDGAAEHGWLYPQFEHRVSIANPWVPATDLAGYTTGKFFVDTEGGIHANN